MENNDVLLIYIKNIKKQKLQPAARSWAAGCAYSLTKAVSNLYSSYYIIVP